ncbi:MULTISPECIES: hypothetical protein [unclassified Streptomyces]|uniref:hypothetical protein n=1 Tax=unclassified Streptomyces TaxID=2593676 RepID=UPI001300E1E7|nr:hypothetical protein [Streptomyces sp. CB02058]
MPKPITSYEAGISPQRADAGRCDGAGLVVRPLGEHGGVALPVRGGEQIAEP